MAEIKCDIDCCRYHQEDGSCGKDQYYVSIEEKLTAAGFIPTCSDFEEGYEEDREDD